MMPGDLASIVPPDDGDIYRKLRDLQRQLDELRGARRLEAASIGAGGLTIKNGGTLTVENADGKLMPLSQLAFGATATSSPYAQFDCAGNGVWRADPADTPLTVTVSAGRLLLIVSAQMWSAYSRSNAILSWSVEGEAWAVAPSQFRALVVPTAGYPAAGYSCGSFAFLHTQMPSGTYTVAPRYRCDQYGANADTASFANRTLAALPF